MAEQINENEKAEKQEISLTEKKNPRKKILIVAVFMILITVIIAAAFLHKNPSDDPGSDASPDGSPGGRPDDVRISENTIVASGTVSPGLVREEFDLDYIETELEIEEIYLRSGMKADKGEKIAKLTDKSVEDARNELTDACTEADLAYRAGVITLEKAKIEARYEYDSNILNGTQAQEVYNETLQELQTAIDDAKKDIDKANEDIAEYTDAIENDSYDEKYQVSYLNAKYEQDYKLLKDKMEEWELPWPYVTGQDDNGDPVNAPMNMPNLSTARKLYQEVDEEYQEYKKAKEEYDMALTNAAYELEKRKLEMTGLEEALQTARNNYDEGVIRAKAAYDTAITKYQNAQSIYDTAMKKAQEELDSLQDEKEDASERLAEFEERIGDGFLYTTNSGDILMVPLEEHTALRGNSMLLAYANTDELTVMVSVSQEYIDSISVGEDALVTVSGYGDFNGTVQSINPVSQSSSRSSVTYLVTVKLEGDVTMLSANLSAQVMFGREGETDGNKTK